MKEEDGADRPRSAPMRATGKGTLTVIKYGGGALGSEVDVRQVLDDLAPKVEQGPCIVVVSAREGVTDLLKTTMGSRRDRSFPDKLLDRLRALHPTDDAATRRAIERLLARLEKHLLELRRISGRTSGGGRKPSPSLSAARLSDAILAQGERLASVWFSSEARRRGIPAQPVEADRIGLLTDDHPGEAIVLLERSEGPVRNALLPLLSQGTVPVVTGFLGRSVAGRVATLGRGGSDYSATCLAQLLGASRVELVKKDVSILSADPRHVQAARPLLRLSYEEAEELAQFGAKVLHPLTVEPARARGVEVVIRSLRDPSRTTTIGPAIPGEGIRALTLLSPTAMLLLRVPGGRQKKGVIAEVSRVLAESELNVITMFTSSALLILLVESAMGRKARRVLERFARSDGASLEGPSEAALVTAIGDGVLSDLGGLPSEVSARALGVSATSRTLSFAVPASAGEETLVCLHRVLVETPHRSPVPGVSRPLARASLVPKLP